jgi:hypothetical protein
MRCGLPSAVGLAFVVGLAATAGLQVRPAKAWEYDTGTSAAVTPASSHSSTAAQKKGWSTAEEPVTGHNAARRYFVEFRARNAASYGHMYVMYGEVNDRHEIIRSEIAGFFPAGDRRDCENCSVYNWTIGHVLPVPSEIGASDGDLEEQYVLARFRVWIDAAQYKKLVAYINQRKANKGPWNAFFNNCVTFGRDVAVFLNLKVPLLAAFSPSVVMYPKNLVEALREANGVKKEQGPLKDAPGLSPAEASTKVQAKGSQPAAETVAQPAAETVAQPAAETVAKKAAPIPSSSKKRLANQRDDGKVVSATNR